MCNSSDILTRFKLVSLGLGHFWPFLCHKKSKESQEREVQSLSTLRDKGRATTGQPCFWQDTAGVTVKTTKIAYHSLSICSTRLLLLNKTLNTRTGEVAFYLLRLILKYKLTSASHGPEYNGNMSQLLSLGRVSGSLVFIKDFVTDPAKPTGKNCSESCSKFMDLNGLSLYLD